MFGFPVYCLNRYFNKKTDSEDEDQPMNLASIMLSWVLWLAGAAGVCTFQNHIFKKCSMQLHSCCKCYFKPQYGCIVLLYTIDVM